jgi:hypothetical protein
VCTEADHHVYELVSMYDLDTCMNRTAQALDGVRHQKEMLAGVDRW